MRCIKAPYLAYLLAFRIRSPYVQKRNGLHDVASGHTKNYRDVSNHLRGDTDSNGEAREDRIALAVA